MKGWRKIVWWVDEIETNNDIYSRFILSNVSTSLDILMYDSHIYGLMLWGYIDMWFHLLCDVMSISEVIHYDDISRYEACGDCM